MSGICETQLPIDVKWAKSKKNPMTPKTDHPLIEAAKSSSKTDLVSQLLDAGCPGNHVDKTGRTALHWAIEYGHHNVANVLINSGRVDLDVKDNKGHTPLFIACKSRRAGLAIQLIVSGCNVTLADKSGNTALHKAVLASSEPDNRAVVAALCRAGSDVNYPNLLGSTPFHESLRIGNAGVVKTFLDNGADVLCTSNNKMAPFLSAIFHYKISQTNVYSELDDILAMLIERGCHLSRGHGQWSPLSASVNIENSDIPVMLIIHGCRLDSPIPLERSNIVEMFAKCNPHVVKLFVMAGYHVTADDLQQCAKRVPAFSKSFLRLNFPGLQSCRHHVDTLAWLKKRAKTPFSLTELSRRTVRKALNAATDDTSIVKQIPMLPLPTSMKRFVALADCISLLPNVGCYIHHVNL